MPSSYPSSLDNLNATKSNSTAQVTDHPGHHNDLANAINAVQATLGVNPTDALATIASLRTLGTGALQAAAGNDARLSDTRTPTDDSVTAAKINTALKGGPAAAVESLRALGATSTTAAAGNDARLSDVRTPSDNSVTAAKVNTAIKGGPAAAVEALRALGTTSTTAAAGNDARLSDSRAPTAHKTSHEPGGSDAMAVDAAAATGSLRTLGTSATSAAAGNDSRLSDTRAPTDDSVTAAKVNTALKGGPAAAVESLRALGTTATTACAGNDARLSDQRTPSAGSVTAAKFGTTPAARIYHNANQSINNTTTTALAFNTERFDTDTMHDTSTNNSRLTATTAGLYVMTASVYWAGNATGVREVGFRVNGSVQISLEEVTGAAAGSFQSTSTMYKLAATDYVEVIVWHSAGVALNVNVAPNYSPEFSIAFVGTGA